jgi:hypothetical protein
MVALVMKKWPEALNHSFMAETTITTLQQRCINSTVTVLVEVVKEMPLSKLLPQVDLKDL